MKKIRTYLILAAIVVVLVNVVILLVLDRRRMKTDHQSATATSTSVSADDTLGNGRLKGCDISHWNGTLDWADVKDHGIDFIFIKATQGADYVDPDFANNWATANNYGIVRGAYHFYQPKDDPVAQANHFLETINLQKGDLRPVLDIEVLQGVAPADVAQQVETWVKTVHEKLGVYPIIYCDRPFWDTNINKDLGECPLWIAEWEKGSAPMLPTGWKQWTFWQYTADGTVPGIPATNGKTDLDYFNGDEVALRSYRIR